MKLRTWLPAAAILFATNVAAQQPAQQPPKPTLTLEEAIALARQNNPDFLALKNDAAVADWQVREAYGQLLPGASASTSFQYQASGPARFGIFTGADLGVGETPDYYLSNYNLGVNYSLSGASLVAPGRAKAMRRATEANIDASDFNLQAQVTQLYLAVLRAQDAVTLAQQELEQAENNRKLAAARVAVGAAIPMELKQAEVEKGRAEVGLLQAQNLVETERLRLIQGLGIELQQELELTSRFQIFEVNWTQQELVAEALSRHPQLLAARANTRANEAGVKMARSAYLPSLDFSAGWSGYTRQAGDDGYLLDQARDAAQGAFNRCSFENAVAQGHGVPGFPQPCPPATLTPDQEQQILSSNDVFPFNYTREPLFAQVRISLPIFQGFTRELQVEQAKANALDARHRLRAEELRIQTEVATALASLKTAHRSVALEERNRELANDQLLLAQERYRLGAASFLELQEAVTIKARADRAYLISLYQFHENMAALEAAVGRNLKQSGEARQ